MGDAQQSIYRFRGAEVEVFRRQERKGGLVCRARGDCRGRRPCRRTRQLVRNFRSHDEVLRYVARVFDGDDGGLMQGFLDLEASDGRKDTLVADASRRRALFVAGGSTQDARRQGRVRSPNAFAHLPMPASPRRHGAAAGPHDQRRRLRRAFRDQGLDCVIAGGSVFAQAAEVQTVRATVCALANPADTARGLMPLLSPRRCLRSALRSSALATKLDSETGETSRRNIDMGIMSDSDVPGLQDLPLVKRAREVLRYALRRAGRDSFAAIARDVVNASGWFVRWRSAAEGKGHCRQRAQGARRRG